MFCPAPPTIHSLRQMETMAGGTKEVERDGGFGECFPQKAEGL